MYNNLNIGKRSSRYDGGTEAAAHDLMEWENQNRNQILSLGEEECRKPMRRASPERRPQLAPSLTRLSLLARTGSHARATSRAREAPARAQTKPEVGPPWTHRWQGSGGCGDRDNV